MNQWISRPESHRLKWRLRIGEGRKTIQRLTFDTEGAAEEARRAWLRERPGVRERVRARMDRLEPTGHVYFIRSGAGIKIGFTDNIFMRMSALLNAHPRRLALLAMIPGTRTEEGELHRMFAEDRMEGEWFRPSRRLRAFVADLRGVAAREIGRAGP
jgi:hypothetical protein